MNRVLSIAKHDIASKYKSGDFKCMALFYISSIISTFFIVNRSWEESCDQGVRGFFISVLFLALIILSNFTSSYKNEINNGYFETLMSICSGYTFSLSRFLSLLFLSFALMLFCLPIMILFYKIRVSDICTILLASFMFLTVINSLIVLIDSISKYFRNIWHLLSGIILIFAMPHVIILALIIQCICNNQYDLFSLLTMMLGITMIIVPVVIFLSGYLNNNAYNSF